ncbi:MAG: lipopolysaccharide biosynthesis protein RfbH [Candidatus Omnitrophica bacterium]|nr:lipopolysaccharide biosynthesis protein RfbH [Candidatus Omnitrophota bacterium]
MSPLKEQILNMVDQYITGQKKGFTPGETVVQYSGPVFDALEIKAIVGTVLDGWFGLNKDSTKFEELIAERLAKKYSVYVNSGSSANLIALETMKELYLKDPKRNKIIIPAASFPTTLNPIIQLGFEPVFVDINLGTYNLIDSQIMKALEDESVIGLMYAHSMGNPVLKTKKYYEIIKKREGFLIEDCCDALGSRYNNDLVGRYSDAATLSLYAAHHITTGEGGIVALNNIKEKNIAVSYRDWGRGCFCTGKDVLSKEGSCKNRFSDWLGDGTITDHRYVYTRLGYNLKPLELQASMGLEQLKKLDGFIQKRKDNFKLLNNFMKKYEDFFILPKAEENCDPSWFSYPISVKENFGFKRSDIVKFLEDNKIQTRNFFGGNLLKHPGYKSIKYKDKFSIDNSSFVTQNTFMIGVYPGITEEMYNYVFSVIDKFFKTERKKF